MTFTPKSVEESTDREGSFSNQERANLVKVLENTLHNIKVCRCKEPLLAGSG